MPDTHLTFFWTLPQPVLLIHNQTVKFIAKRRYQSSKYVDILSYIIYLVTSTIFFQNIINLLIYAQVEGPTNSSITIGLLNYKVL